MSDYIRMVGLTGTPVSAELENLMSACRQGETPDIAKIMATPEMQVAERTAGALKDEISRITPNGDWKTSSIETPERDGMRARIVDLMLERGSVVRGDDGKFLEAQKTGLDGNPILKDGRPVVDTAYPGVVVHGYRMDVVIGLPAAGKSSCIVNPLSSELGSRVLDNDMIKELIPEFREGWGANPVHKESSDINDTVLERALENGDNIVIPKIGSNADSLMDDENGVIGQALKAGYKVYVHFVDLDPGKTMDRMVSRFCSDDRYLPPANQANYVVDGVNGCAVAFEELKADPRISGVTHWSTDVERGQAPVLIEQQNCGDLECVRDARTEKTSDEIERETINARTDIYYEDTFDGQGRITARETAVSVDPDGIGDWRLGAVVRTTLDADDRYKVTSEVKETFDPLTQETASVDEFYRDKESSITVHSEYNGQGKLTSREYKESYDNTELYCKATYDRNGVTLERTVTVDGKPDPAEAETRYFSPGDTVRTGKPMIAGDFQGLTWRTEDFRETFSVSVPDVTAEGTDPDPDDIEDLDKLEADILDIDIGSFVDMCRDATDVDGQKDMEAGPSTDQADYDPDDADGTIYDGWTDDMDRSEEDDHWDSGGWSDDWGGDW